MSATNNTQNNLQNNIKGSARKRRRTEDGESLGNGSKESTTTAAASEPVVRDPDYYKDSGDCVIRVENTLFKVHRAFLMLDSSAFDGMFSLPSSDFTVEGLNDDKPVILYGDTVEQFRALLWVLYALPHQIEALLVNKVSRLPELLAIAEIANKYHFGEVGAWCMRTLRAVFSMAAIAPIHLERLLRLSMLSNDESLCASMVSTLSARLMDGSLPPTEVLIIADRHQIRELQGVAYYAQLMALQRNDPNDLTFPVGCPLSKDQRVRLLVGSWSLARKWDSLRNANHPPPCSVHGMSCTYWVTVWRSQANGPSITQHASSDVLGKIKSMQNLLQQTTINNYAAMMRPPGMPSMPPVQSYYTPCTSAALAGVQKILDDIHISLPDYFSDRMLGLDEESA